MQVTIDRNFCGHHPAGCEQCFGEFLRHEVVPDRACITSMRDDGRPETTVEIKSGPYSTTLVVTDENREQIMYDGWIRYANLPQEAFEIVPPHGGQVRRMVRELQAAR